MSLGLPDFDKTFKIVFINGQKYYLDNPNMWPILNSGIKRCTAKHYSEMCRIRFPGEKGTTYHSVHKMVEHKGKRSERVTWNITKRYRPGKDRIVILAEKIQHAYIRYRNKRTCKKPVERIDYPFDTTMRIYSDEELFDRVMGRTVKSINKGAQIDLSSTKGWEWPDKDADPK